MPDDEILTDDYVAGLLTEEARDCSLKFSAMGMEAFRTDKKPANHPKPNTRFLRHIIKNTDTHNKTLLAKEAAESKARLRHMERAEETKRLKTNPNAKDITRRQMGDIRAILGGQKRRKPHGDDDGGDAKASGSSSRDSKHATESGSSRRHHESSSKSHDDRRHHRERSSRTDRGSSRDRYSRHEEKRKPRHHRERHAVTGDDDDKDDASKHHRSHSKRDLNRSRSRSPHRRRRSRSPHEQRSRRHRQRSPVRSASKPSLDTTEARNDGSDSDPLEELIGPAPPPKYRGRGTVGGAAGIDRRFSESYDPKTDVQMNDDGDGSAGPGAGDWDDAVEAFRDRQKLRQGQEQRLLEAGFAPRQIVKTTQQQQNEVARPDEGVTWSKAGEKREWDRDKGKATGEDV